MIRRDRWGVGGFSFGGELVGGWDNVGSVHHSTLVVYREESNKAIRGEPYHHLLVEMVK